MMLLQPQHMHKDLANNVIILRKLLGWLVALYTFWLLSLPPCRPPCPPPPPQCNTFPLSIHSLLRYLVQACLPQHLVNCFQEVHTMFQYTMWMIVHPAYLVLSSATLSNEKFGCSVRASTAKRILFLNHRNRKVVGGTHNVLVHFVDDCAPNLSNVILCNPFIYETFCCSFLIKILWFPPLLQQ